MLLANGLRSYHGGEFIRGDCRKMLHNIDILAQIAIIDALPLVRAFCEFFTVTQTCFGSNLNVNFCEDLSHLKLHIKVSM